MLKLRWRALSAGVVAALLFASIPQPVAAFSTFGCRWSSTTVDWRNAGSTAAYRTAASDAIAAWDATSTPLTFRSVGSGEDVRVWDVDFGNTGFDGIMLDQNYQNPLIYSCGGSTWDRRLYAMLNSYYATSYSSAKKKSTFVHEIGHSLGLAHWTQSLCSDVTIMQPDTHRRYDICGRVNPRPDDVNGINFIY